MLESYFRRQQLNRESELTGRVFDVRAGSKISLQTTRGILKVKKAKLIVIGLVLVTMALCLIACSSDDPLVGKWKLVDADVIYYFVSANNIEFFKDGKVYEDSYEEWGTWTVIGDGRLRVTDSADEIHNFNYVISNNQLTLTDRDGDVNVYRRG